MAEGPERASAGPPGPELVAWLRQMAIGLSVHRLYAGRVVPATREATERIIAAAGAALAAGDREVVLGSGGLAGVEGDESLDRLAGACFERRIEHLRLDGVPTAAELDVLFAALSEDPAELAQQGGVPSRLEDLGVHAIVASEDVPDPTTGAETPEHLLGASAWTAALDTGPMEALLELEAHPEQDAVRLYVTLRRIADRLPDDAVARSPFYQRVEELVAVLPASQRPRFERLLLDSVGDHRFAERTLGHLTDVALADLVGRVARHEGRDPRRLAVEVAGLGGRHANLPRLVLERGLARNVAEQASSAPVSPATARAAPPVDWEEVLLDAPAPPADPSSTARATVDAPDRSPARLHPLAAAFPDDAAAGRVLADTALVDYLANAPHPDQLMQVAAAVRERLRVDVVDGAASGVAGLVAAVQAGAVHLEHGLARELDQAVAGVLDVEVVVAALALGAAPARGTLAPFGRAALAPIVAALEPQHPEPVREAALILLRELAPDHLDDLGAAIGPRSAVVRRQLVGVLAPVRKPAVVAVLGRLAQHSDPDLQRRVVAALTSHEPAAAAAVLGGIVSRAKDRQVQRDGLDALAANASPSARELLRRLGDRSTSPLSPGLRRRARKLGRAGS